jgi:hypothetical protein
MCNSCSFKVSDAVDWKDTFHSKQTRYWHGTIIEDLGVGNLGPNSNGHKFLILWSLSTNWGRFKKLPEGKWQSPKKNSHQQVELCTELQLCSNLPPLHPNNLS